MTEKISPELFNHLVRLAALELGPEESNYLRDQLNKQLKAIEELEAIPVDPRTALASHGVPYTAENSQKFRGDVWLAYPDPESILAQAPEIEEGYIIVPEIPHTEI